MKECYETLRSGDILVVKTDGFTPLVRSRECFLAYLYYNIERASGRSFWACRDNHTLIYVDWWWFGQYVCQIKKAPYEKPLPSPHVACRPMWRLC